MSNKKGILGDFTRRKFLAVTGATALAAPFINNAWAADRTLTISDTGGPVGEAYRKAFYDPFFEKTGIEIIAAASSHSPTGAIKAMVEAKNYALDGALLAASHADILTSKGYLEPIGALGSNGKEIADAYKTDYLLGTSAYATVLAYNTKNAGDNAPKNYADFWNVDKFPASRAMRKKAEGTLEQALLASGVAPKDLYPLDVDRAFKKLDEIRDNVEIWWTGGAQCSQLLKTEEIEMLASWNGRIQTAINDGAPVKIIWDGGMASYAGFGMLAGGPKVELMREFVEFSCSAVQQAEYVKYAPDGPCNPNAFKYIPEKVALNLPTNPIHADKMFTLNSRYWSEHTDKLTERFEAWLLS